MSQLSLRYSVAPAYSKASVDSRFLAAMIDGVVSALGFVPALILAAVGENTGVSDPGGIALGLYVLGLAWGLFHGFGKDAMDSGQSLGKRAVGLMVVYLPTNQPCEFGQSALRALVAMLLTLIPVVGWLVEPVMIVVSENGQRLGDRAASTQVITVAEHTRQPPL